MNNELTANTGGVHLGGDTLARAPAAADPAAAGGWLSAASAWLRRRSTTAGCALLIFLAAIYWGLIASDRFVSELHVVVDRTDFGNNQALDLGGLITGGSGASRVDMLLLRDHLLSLDMLDKLQARLDLRAHYSDSERDPLSRMWSPSIPKELFHRHFLERTTIEADDGAGVLRIRAQAYDANMAQAINKAMLEEGEAFMNDIGHRLAREQVSFLEQQVAQSAERSTQARQRLLAFQNKTGLISPQAKAESLVAIAARLEGQIADLKARRSGMLGFLSPQASDVAQLDLQIGALERQLAEQQKRLAGPQASALNARLEEYQQLETEATFAQDVYRTSLNALEKGRIDLSRTLKKLSVLQSPSLPEYALEPKRIYNLMAFALAVLALAGIAHLLAAIVRDHRD